MRRLPKGCRRFALYCKILLRRGFQNVLFALVKQVEIFIQTMPMPQQARNESAA
jgi:hypothetical protein